MIPATGESTSLSVQDFGKLAASASSALEETTTMHLAENVLDGELSTVRVEGIHGVGTDEWIKLETTDAHIRCWLK